ncbi:hypothetical protein OsJ_02043 [Oryza sativa Japonica Group]|uniref:Uncharacterized protein n=1 Tax=Oryza sativa subsp. japonica TaxID=39947 RepID=B9EXA1_ORYSJ|nr:hypothetical protein OsJ_02043 [Oryza sativa Japonica Group]
MAFHMASKSSSSLPLSRAVSATPGSGSENFCSRTECFCGGGARLCLASEVYDAAVDASSSDSVVTQDSPPYTAAAVLNSSLGLTTSDGASSAAAGRTAAIGTAGCKCGHGSLSCCCCAWKCLWSESF